MCDGLALIKGHRSEHLALICLQNFVVTNRFADHDTILRVFTGKLRSSWVK